MADSVKALLQPAHRQVDLLSLQAVALCNHVIKALIAKRLPHGFGILDESNQIAAVRLQFEVHEVAAELDEL
jgi:hypothetical protein